MKINLAAGVDIQCREMAMRYFVKYPYGTISTSLGYFFTFGRILKRMGGYARPVVVCAVVCDCFLRNRACGYAVFAGGFSAICGGSAGVAAQQSD